MHARLRPDGAAILTLSAVELAAVENALTCGQLACADVLGAAGAAPHFLLERLQSRRTEASNAVHWLGRLASVIATAVK